MNKNNKIKKTKQITISKDSYPFTLKSKINLKNPLRQVQYIQNEMNH